MKSKLWSSAKVLSVVTALGFMLTAAACAAPVESAPEPVETKTAAGVHTEGTNGQCDVSYETGKVECSIGGGGGSTVWCPVVGKEVLYCTRACARYARTHAGWEGLDDCIASCSACFDN